MTEDTLRQALEQHRRNLAQLEVQAAQYGAGQEPLWLANNLRAERAAIEKLEEALDQLAHEAEAAAASAATSQRRRNKAPMTDLSMSDLGDKIDAVRDDIHRLDLRLTRVEADLDNLRRALLRNGHYLEPLPRWVIVLGGVFSVLTLALLILLSVRVW